MESKNVHTIWSNINIDYDSWAEDIREDYPDYSNDKLYELVNEMNDEYLEDERINLDVKLGRTILVIADLGLWNGRRSGYKKILSGNIKDCLYSDTDYAEWYVDSLGDLRCNAIHHDGTNHYLYRVYKDDATDVQIANLKDKLYYGTATRKDITRVTRRLGDDIAAVYGFKIRGGNRNEVHCG